MADCASLERMCGGNSTEGSNPSLSAIVYGHSESIRVNYCILKKAVRSSLMIFDLNGNYLSGNFVLDVSDYEGLFGQSLD